MEVLFKLKLTKEYNLQCSIILENSTEMIIHLSQDERCVYVPSITFHTNTISLCEEIHGTNTINFIKEWIEQPNDFKLYKFYFQNKQFEVLSEVLFSIIITEFKRIIEKEYIIQNTLIE